MLNLLLHVSIAEGHGDGEAGQVHDELEFTPEGDDGLEVKTEEKSA